MVYVYDINNNSFSLLMMPLRNSPNCEKLIEFNSGLEDLSDSTDDCCTVNESINQVNFYI